MMRSTSNGRMNNTWSKNQISTSKQEVNQEYLAQAVTHFKVIQEA